MKHGSSLWNSLRPVAYVWVTMIWVTVGMKWWLVGSPVSINDFNIIIILTMRVVTEIVITIIIYYCAFLVYKEVHHHNNRDSQHEDILIHAIVRPNYIDKPKKSPLRLKTITFRIVCFYRQQISLSLYITPPAWLSHADDLIPKSHNVSVPYPTIHHSEQKCTHFCSEWCIAGYETYATMHHSKQKCTHLCSEWCIVGYETDALWDSWDWSNDDQIWWC